MSRFNWKQMASLTASIDTTPEIYWNGAEFGMVFIPDGSGITTLTFHASDCPEGEFEPLYGLDSAGAPVAVTLTVAANRAVPLPEELRGCRAFKMVANAAGAVKLSFQE